MNEGGTHSRGHQCLEAVTVGCIFILELPAVLTEVNLQFELIQLHREAGILILRIHPRRHELDLLDEATDLSIEYQRGQKHEIS
jgi:hypothetical protein